MIERDDSIDGQRVVLPTRITMPGPQQVPAGFEILETKRKTEDVDPVFEMNILGRRLCEARCVSATIDALCIQYRLVTLFRKPTLTKIATVINDTQPKIPGFRKVPLAISSTL